MTDPALDVLRQLRHEVETKLDTNYVGQEGRGGATGAQKDVLRMIDRMIARRQRAASMAAGMRGDR